MGTNSKIVAGTTAAWGLVVLALQQLSTPPWVWGGILIVGLIILLICGIWFLIANTPRPDGPIGQAVSRENAARLVERDEWLQEAVFYVVHGRWLGATEQALSGEGQGISAGTVTAQMRELAGDGKLLIWGKLSPMRLHELIPQAYWIDHQIDVLTVFADRPERMKTEQTAHGASFDIYTELKISKAQVELLRTSGVLRP